MIDFCFLRCACNLNQLSAFNSWCFDFQCLLYNDYSNDFESFDKQRSTESLCNDNAIIFYIQRLFWSTNSDAVLNGPKGVGWTNHFERITKNRRDQTNTFDMLNQCDRLDNSNNNKKLVWPVYFYLASDFQLERTIEWDGKCFGKIGVKVCSADCVFLIWSTYTMTKICLPILCVCLCVRLLYAS